MVGGVDTIGNALANIYSSNNARLENVMGQIASGKKIQTPSDDFSGYVQASSVKSSLSDYSEIKQDLMSAQTSSKKAIEVGTALYEDLVELRELAEKYDKYSAGSDERKAVAAEFEALKVSVNRTITNNADVYSTAVSTAVTTVDLDPGAGTNNFTVGFLTDTGDVLLTSDITGINGTALTATAPPAAIGATTYQNIDAAIAKSAKFLVGAEQMDKGITRQVNLMDTVVQTKQAVISEIEDVNDAEALAKQTDLSVRQQAAISMMSQANVSRQGMMRLFM